MLSRVVRGGSAASGALSRTIAWSDIRRAAYADRQRPPLCLPRASGRPLKILSIEDHELFQEGLRHAVRSLPGAPELLEARSAHEAWRVLAAEPDVVLVLLDLGLPDVDGLDLLRDLRERHPAIAVAVLSASEQPARVRAALDRGASGFAPKSAAREALTAALSALLAGEVFVPASLRAAADAIPTPRLSPRQREVAALLVRGLTNREIAQVLGVQPGTVKTHVETILAVLQVANRTEAVLALVARGVVAGPEQG